MYEKDGEKYFIVDSHMHFWDATPQNWVKGQEQFAKGWIECFHAYQSLGPADTHWSLEHFEGSLGLIALEHGHLHAARLERALLPDW